MSQIVRIPVRVVRPEGNGAGADRMEAGQSRLAARMPHKPAIEERMAPASPGQIVEASAQTGEPDWCDRALRLQAEMDNYRKRQQRLAQDRVEEERQRLLRAFLGVVDDLERALAAPAGDLQELREGVDLARRTALQLLEKEGVEQIDAHNQPFDPNWQEAISAVAHNSASAEPDTVLQVLEAGYRLGDRLLRPARVVVAV